MQTEELSNKGLRIDIDEFRTAWTALDTLHLQWTPDHERALAEAAAAWVNASPLASDLETAIKNNKNLPGDILCWIDPPSPVELFRHLKVPVAILSAFRTEYANVLDDRGEQTSLFGNALTNEQKAIWPNYYDAPPIARRFVLLAAGNTLHNFSKAVNHSLESITGKGPADMPNITTKILQTFLRPSSKPVQAMFNNSLTLDIPQELRLEPRWAKKPITTAITLGLSPEAIERKLNSLPALTPYDKEVHHAVASLAAAGCEYFTPRMLYQALTGNKNADLKPGWPQYAEICSSLDKMMMIIVRIDTAQEIKFYPGLQMEYSGPLLAIEKATVKLNNETVKDAYHLFRPPILSIYSHDKKQVAAIPIETHCVPKMDKRRDAVVLRGYLEDRITAMKGKNNVESNRILYSSIYEYLEIPEGNTPILKKKRMNIRDKVKTILEHWKDIKFIRGYTEIRQGRALYAVDIKL